MFLMFLQAVLSCGRVNTRSLEKVNYTFLLNPKIVTGEIIVS